MNSSINNTISIHSNGIINNILRLCLSVDSSIKGPAAFFRQVQRDISNVADVRHGLRFALQRTGAKWAQCENDRSAWTAAESYQLS